MHSLNLPTYLGLAYCTALAIATPLQGAPKCDPIIKIDSQLPGPGTPVNSAGYCDAEGGGCVLVQESSYTVGVTWTVGANLGIAIEDIVSAGLNFEVSKSEETGTTEGKQKECPDGAWMCALAITPTVLKAKGTRQRRMVAHGPCRDVGKPEPYEVEMPLKKGGTIERSGIDVCACKDFKGWADTGAPDPCPQPCARSI